MVKDVTLAVALLNNLLTLINPLNAELNPICHLLALLGGATIVVVSRLRVKAKKITRMPRSRLSFFQQIYEMGISRL